MTLIDFAHKLNGASARSATMVLLCDFINEHPDQYSENDVQKFVAGLREDQITSFGGKLGFCRNYCLEELTKEGNKSEKEYLEKLQKTLTLLEGVSKVYQSVIESRKTAETSADAALVQQKEVLRELNSKVKAYKDEIDESKKEMQRISTSFNDKIFSVLINTVSLLGIFVTIAFAGFGVASIFSNIDLATALSSEEAFVKNIFYILLTSLLSYNLLLLLVYFIFRISRPLSSLPMHIQKRVASFSESINLTAFLWIDGILAVLTIATLIVCLSIW